MLAAVRQELAAALERIVELEAQVNHRAGPPAFVKPNRPKTAGEGQPRKKRGAEHNRSRKRSQPTRIERHVLEQCPDCGYRLRGESLAYSREVIELPPPPPVDVIEHQVIKRWCPQCETWHSPKLKLSGQVIGQGRIGVRVLSRVSYLRLTERLCAERAASYCQRGNMAPGRPLPSDPLLDA